MSENDEELARVCEIMIDTFDLDELDVTRETTAQDIEEWDSLSHIRLIVAIEREFKIEFSNAEIEGFQSVGDLLESIVAKSAG